MNNLPPAAVKNAWGVGQSAWWEKELKCARGLKRMRELGGSQVVVVRSSSSSRSGKLSSLLYFVAIRRGCGVAGSLWPMSTPAHSQSTVFDCVGGAGLWLDQQWSW